MTYSEFERKVKKKSSFDKYRYYLLSIGVIIFSIVLLFFIITRPENFKGNHLFHYLSFVFLLLLGVYGLYKIPNRYKIVRFKNSQSNIKKKQAIEKFLTQMNIVTTLSDNYYSFTFRKSFWNTSYEIYLFYDDNSVCFSVQGQDNFDGGIIDFGGTEKLRRRIRDDIQTLLV